jgi:diguanylate cyclase (GGDEF)-like protein/PAS domain S-box-containing protein
MILDLLPVGLLIHQQQGILFANQAASSFLAQNQDALVGQHLLDHLSPDQSEDLSKILQDALAGDEVFKMDRLVLNPPGGQRRIISATIAKLPWEGTPVAQILLQDITLQTERERQLQNMMATDGLTGAQNRRSFIEYVQQISTYPNLGSCGVILWDIDLFKNVNDTYGHQAGDEALRAVVIECEQVLARRTLMENPEAPRAMLSRVGGEEFAVIIPGVDEDEALHYAEAIRASIEARAIKSANWNFNVTVSLGVVLGDMQFDDIDTLMGMADKALYAAKGNGRNQVVFAQSAMQFPPDEKRVSRNINKRDMH